MERDALLYMLVLILCSLYFQSSKGSLVDKFPISVNWFNEVCSVDWQVWCCPMDLFRWGYPTVCHFCMNRDKTDVS